MGKKQPELRFTNYSEEWVEKRFGDEFDFLSNNTLSRDKLNYESGEGLNVHYGDVLIKFGEYLNVEEEVLPFITDISIIDKLSNSILRDGDIIIADTAEDITVGKCTEIINVGNKKILSGLHTIPCRPKKAYSPRFLGYCLNSDKYHNKLLPLMQGVKVTSISKSGLQDTEIVVTENQDEQYKIGIFLSRLDELIKDETEKYNKLIILKNTMLEKMFPKEKNKVPEIRFSRYTEDWKQCKLGDVVGVYDGVHQTPDYQDNGVMFLSVENIATLTSDKYISEEAFKRDYKVYPEKGDVLMTRIGDVGTTNVVETTEKLAFYVSLALLKPIDVDSYFLSNVMQSPLFKKGLKNRTLVTAIPQKINKDEIGKVEIFLPRDKKEQEQIGTYFKNLDRLITLHMCKVKKIKNIKTACMRKMFL